MSDSDNIRFDTSRKGLIEGIEREALSEAEEITRLSQRSAEERLEAAEKQAEAIIREAENKAVERVAAIKKSNASRTSIAVRKFFLKARGQLIQQIMERVTKELQEMIDSPPYRAVLLDWIVEAALGLNAPEAAVQSSPAELPLIDAGLLRQVEQEVKSLTGRSVKIRVSEGDPLTGQGVVLVAKSGKVAFNNQVKTRLLRHDSEVKKIVYQELQNFEGQAQKLEIFDRRMPGLTYE